MNLKLFSAFLILFLILNLLLFAFGKINDAIFWTVIIAIGIIAYKILPKLKKNKV